MARYLVTGGCGFIGSRLVRALLAGGSSVRVLDNFSTGGRSTLEALGGGAELVEGNVEDPVAVEKAVSDVDYVLHQAALPSVQRSVELPLESHATNLTGTLTLLEAARRARVRRFVYASSSSVYGDSAELPKVETMPPNPLSPYAVGKLGGEFYCRVYHRLHGLETVALRYFNVFGPGQRPNSPYAAVIPRFISALRSGESPVIYGDGGQSRDFTYVDNVVEANVAACAANGTVAGEAFNIACGESVTLLQLLEELETLTGRRNAPRFEPSRRGDVRDSLADIGKARRLLGYDPRVPFREGLRRTLEAAGVLRTP